MRHRDAESLIGTVFAGEYKVLECLGLGGWATIYAAEQVEIARNVAIKVLDIVNEFDDAEMKRSLKLRFQREAHATSLLEHPNTVRIHSFGETRNGTLFLVLELLEGKPLNDILALDGALPPQRAASIAIQVCNSLDEAHRKKIVHRDIKPANLFICSHEGVADFVKVVDFGLVHMFDVAHATQLTSSGQTVGSPAYMAPEQIMASGISPVTDLYALGVVLFEMLTGRPPFTGETVPLVALRHINDAPPPLEIPGLSEEQIAPWQRLVHKLLEKRPADRPESAAETARMIEDLSA